MLVGVEFHDAVEDTLVVILPDIVFDRLELIDIEEE